MRDVPFSDSEEENYQESQKFGSFFVSKSKNRELGAWTQAQRCECDSKHLRVIGKTYKGIEMAGAGLVKAVRILALGTLQIKLKGQSYYHGCVQCQVQCENCGKRTKVTMEYGTKGRRNKYGYYAQYLRQKTETQSINISWDHLENIYKYTWRGVKGRDYSIFSKNCKMYASQLYQAIY